MSSWPLNRPVLGVWPMAMNTPSTSSSVTRRDQVSQPHAGDLAFVDVVNLLDSVFQMNSIFALANALSCMTFEARSLSRR